MYGKILAFFCLLGCLPASSGVFLPKDMDTQDVWTVSGDKSMMPEDFGKGMIWDLSDAVIDRHFTRLYRRYGDTLITRSTSLSFGIVDDLSLYYAGPRLRKVSDAAAETLYTDGCLSRIETPNGYITPQGTRYYIKDHQGNIRQVADSVGAVLQENHYYSYGILMGESSDILAANRSAGWSNGAANPYRYSGNELLTMRNAQLGDFNARICDFQTGRFIQQDRLKEKYYGFNSYNFCAANPIMFSDALGLSYYYNINGDFIFSNNDDSDAIFVVINSSKKFQDIEDEFRRINKSINLIDEILAINPIEGIKITKFGYQLYGCFNNSPDLDLITTLVSDGIKAVKMDTDIVKMMILEYEMLIDAKSSQSDDFVISFDRHPFFKK